MILTPKDIRDLAHASPFKPFRLHLADGRLAAFDARGGMILVDTSVIADILTKDPEWFDIISLHADSSA